MNEKNKSKPADGEWPNTIRTRDELDSALEAGEKSGVSERTFDEIIESARNSLKNG